MFSLCTVRFGYGSVVERFTQFGFSVPVVPLGKRASPVFQLRNTERDGSGFGS